LGSGSKFNLPIDLKNSLKGLAFIVLYNLIEGTIIEILNDSFNFVNLSNIKYVQASKKYKEALLHFQYKVFQKSQPCIVVENIKILPSEIINFKYTDEDGISRTGYTAFISKIGKNSEISGNLDVRKVRELFEKYDLRIPPHNSGSDKILTIKRNRNYVAHGQKRLSDVGQPYTIRELFEFKEATLALLSQCVDSSEYFQKVKPFRKVAAR
jgi:hypothetical protein